MTKLRSTILTAITFAGDCIYMDENPDANPLSDEQNQQFFSHIIESQKRKERELAKRIARKLRQAKDKREDRELAQAMHDLTLDDNSMDIDVVRGQKLELEEDDDATPVKIPAKISTAKAASNVTSPPYGGFLNLLAVLKSEEFRKLLREILQEELESTRKVIEISENQEDHRVDDPMDIDVA
ncbi:unnamed protein product [Rhizophagus irregularis]|nr:unnamed protein product [Rhizophagus irregularis]